jgi:hypothetical protein
MDSIKLKEDNEKEYKNINLEEVVNIENCSLVSYDRIKEKIE